MKKTLFIFLILFISYKFSFSQIAGNALHFDGVDDIVSANLPSMFNNLSSTDFTIEAWVKPQGSSFSRIIFAQASSSNFATISTGQNNNIFFYVVEGSITYSLATNNTLPLNSWTHVAARWQTSTNTVEVFFNGILQPGSSGGSSSVGTLNNLSIGTRPGGAQYFSGEIDEVRIWNVARSNCEILSNYQRKMIGMGNEPNLVTYYSFDIGVAGSDNSGVTLLPDLVGSNNGSLLNFGLNGNTSNWINSGASINGVGQASSVVSNTSVTSCSNTPYLFNNQALTVSGVYSDTLTTATGCDSIAFLDLTVLPIPVSIVFASNCNSYYWTQTNTTYLLSGIYNDTLTTIFGCDSIVSLHLTINQPSMGTDVVNACNSYTWIDGNTYTSSDSTAIYTITGGAANGCDSIVSLHLTINQPSSGADVLNACNSYTWIDGNTYTSSNSSATFTIVGGSANGCDSIVSLHLTINQPSTGTDVVTACNSYTWIDGNTYSSSDSTAIYTITGGAANGCDSLVTLDLTINEVTDISTTTLGATINTSNSNANFLWLDCNANFSIINGETGATYTPSINGDYAVQITENGCVDTSECVSITTVDLIKNEIPIIINVFPNPTSGILYIDFFDNNEDLIVQVFDISGRIHLDQTLNIKEDNFIEELNLESLSNGTYYLRVKSLYLDETFRFIKSN
jgi:hypothetical protein